MLERFEYKRATMEDIDELIRTRIIVLRAANKLSDDVDMSTGTFWDMQQNQEIHKDVDWQGKMVEIEMRVSDMDGYKDIAFFHHLMIEKR